MYVVPVFSSQPATINCPYFRFFGGSFFSNKARRRRFLSSLRHKDSLLVPRHERTPETHLYSSEHSLSLNKFLWRPCHLILILPFQRRTELRGFLFSFFLSLPCCTIRGADCSSSRERGGGMVGWWDGGMPGWDGRGSSPLSHSPLRRQYPPPTNLPSHQSLPATPAPAGR